MRVASYSRRRIAPFRAGLQNMRHPDTLELSWVESGAVVGDIAGEESLLGPGLLAIIPPEVLHSSWTLHEECIEHVLHVYAREVASMPPAGIVPVVPFAELLGAIAEDDDREGNAGRLLELLPQVPQRAQELAVDPRLLRAFQAMVAAPEERWSLERLSRVAHMSRFHFSRRYRESFGQSPMRALRQLRVERAAHLLSKGRQSVAEIAAVVGFGSASRLSEAFTEERGVSPSAYRQGRP